MTKQEADKVFDSILDDVTGELRKQAEDVVMSFIARAKDRSDELAEAINAHLDIPGVPDLFEGIAIKRALRASFQALEMLADQIDPSDNAVPAQE